ncbi:response regulator transcription factor [Geomonas sp.]|uniref:response regulator transcription factor n=1 Tax=Geomonas sp. TaxID=2651584 RepID=UPI002B45AF5E|nr:response regulator transcription factor [Geomonas sp.]HJV35331.1 response regulator transcription factor [Geomonas sp.]
MDIVIVEDTKVARAMLVGLLHGHEEYRVVAAVESAEEALSFMAHNYVDLVILDLCLPGISYDQAVRAIKVASPDVDILIFTVSEEDETVFASLKAGATGYILKGASAEQLIAALDEIGDGGSPMSPSIARKVLREFQGPQVSQELQEIISPLSSRETNILELLYRGFNFGQIADNLCISPHTVHTHIKKIYTKLHVNSRSQAIYEAVQKKLIKLDPAHS